MNMKLATVISLALFTGAFFLPDKSDAGIIRLSPTCTLHKAIQAANTDRRVGACVAGRGADTIDFGTQVIARPTLQYPVIRTKITITSRRGGTIHSRRPTIRIFVVSRGGSLGFSRIKIRGGRDGITVTSGGDVPPLLGPAGG